MKRIPLATIILALCLLLPAIYAYSQGQKDPGLLAGADLSLPFARYSRVTQSFSGGHPAIDYRAEDFTPVVAAKEGEVTFIYNACADPTQVVPNPCPTEPGGNRIYIEHNEGLYETRYHHLAQSGFAVQVEQDVVRGEQIALSDNSGTSGASHLDFETLVNGVRVDPYAGNTHWAGEDRIPMGYRDQSGTIQGPFQIADPILTAWLTPGVARSLGSPLAVVDDQFLCPVLGQGAPAAYGHMQEFGRGYILTGCPGEPVVKYPRTFLPNIRAAEVAADWNSTIYIRSLNSYGSSPVNITFYNATGQVVDSRTYHAMPARSTWEVPARNIIFDELLQDRENPNETFIGSAIVASAEDVVVTVRTERVDSVMAYTGVSERSSITVQNLSETPITNLHIVYRRDTGEQREVDYTTPIPGKSSALIVQWDPSYGVPLTPMPTPPPGPTLTPTAGPTPTPAYGWHGGAQVEAAQPIVVIVNLQVRDWPAPGIYVHQSYSNLVGGNNVVFGSFAADMWNAPTPVPTPGVTPYIYQYKTASDVQNLGSAFASIFSHYCDAGGSLPYGGRTLDREPLSVASFYVPDPLEQVPDGARVSVQANGGTVGGIVNIARLDTGADPLERDDFGASYNMPQRRDGLPPSSQVTALAPYHNIASFSVSWSGTDDLAGLASYDVQYRDGPGGAWTGWLTATTATAATFSGGQDAHGYYFRCRARDLVGNLEEWPPDYDATTTVDLTAPSSQVAALPTYSPASFALAWSGSDATSGVAAYDVEYRVGVTNTWSTLFFATQQTQTLFAGDQDGQTYYFHCRAQDYAGNQEAYPGTPDAFTTLDLSPPASSATAPAYDNASPIPVSWTAGDATSGVASTALWYRFNGGDWTDSGLRQAGPAGTFNFNPSAGDGTYYLATRATDNVGNQEAIPTGNGDDSTIYDTVLPSSAVNALPACSPAVFNVSWAGTDPSPSSGIQSYDVQTCTIDCALPDDAVWVDWLADTTQTTAAFSGAHGYPYYFRSRVRDNAGNQEDYYKNADASTVVDAIPPATAVNALPLDNSATTFTVTWSGSDNGCGLAHYDLYYRDESAADWTAWLTNEAPGPGQAPFNGTAGHTYYFCSRGTDLAGNVESCPPLGMGAGEWPIQGDTETRLRPWSRVNALPANPGTNVPGPWIAAPLGGWQKMVTVKVPVVAAQ